jgi:hypothetical protein
MKKGSKEEEKEKEMGKMAKNKKVYTIKINVNELMLNSRKFTTSEIGRGIGYEKPKKGKGSFKRRKKHRKKDEN